MLSTKNKLPKTAMELFKQLPEGLLCQVIDNKIYMSPVPLFEHQVVCQTLSAQIFTYVNDIDLGICIQSPIDVYLDEENAFQPDIIFIAKENLDIIVNGKVKGSPDIVIEVLSEGSKKMDTITKKSIYEKNKVKEYFIINPKTKDTIVYYLKGNKFEKQVSTPHKIKSKLLKKTFSF
jgi:Uma2 family endonuclease